MIVNINDRYRVTIDSYNHTLEESKESGLILKGKHEGKMSQEKWVAVGYFPNMELALVRVMHLQTSDQDQTTDIQGYIDEIRQIVEGLKVGN